MAQQQNQALTKFNQRQMAQTIKSMKEFFQEETETLQTSVKVNADRFDENDAQEFNDFLKQLSRENMQKLSEFWDKKAGTKNVTFETYNDTFQQNFQELLQNMGGYKNDLTAFFTQAKQKELRLEERIDELVIRELKLKRAKKSFKVWKDWVAKRKAKQEVLDFGDNHYINTLAKKSFTSWRSVSYKPAYEEKIYQSSENDVDQVQNHYMDIISVLKNKIRETDDLIEVKKQAKAEFAYSLSKNLMKAISNLSMEVMSLNQMTLQDQRIDTSETKQFVDQINNIVATKCDQIQDVRQGFRQEIQQSSPSKTGGKGGKKGSVISFQEPANLEKVSLYRNDY